MATTFYYISTTGDTFTDKRMLFEARALGLETVCLNPLMAHIAVGDTGDVRVIENGTPVPIAPEAVVYRKSILPLAWVIQRIFTDHGVTGITGKTHGSGKAGLDKLGDYVLLARRGVRVPSTVTVTRLDLLAEALDVLGGDFPIILKKVSGTHGIGVFLVPTANSLKPIAEYIFSENPDAVLLLQSFVKASEGRDIRAVVLDGEVVASVIRDNSGRDFRANVYQGAVPSTTTLTGEQREAAVRAADALGCEFGGVDILLGKDGPMVSEVNSPCDFSFVEQTTGVPLARKILSFLLEKHKGSGKPLRRGDDRRCAAETHSHQSGAAPDPRVSSRPHA